jgi:hypothetical protein
VSTTVPTPPPPPPPPQPHRMSGGRIALVVLGAMALLVGFALVLGGAVLAWAHGTQRDDDGFYRSSSHPLETTTHAIVSERIDLGADVREGDWVPFDDIGTAQVVARGAEADQLFVGIGPSSDVARYLDGVAHDEIEDIRTGPFDVVYERIAGDAEPAPPVEQGFWVASSSGPGERDLRWDVEQGDWTVVLMNADGSPGVAADVAVGLNTGLLLAIGAGLGVAGVLLLALGALFLILGLRHAAAAEAAVPAAVPAGDEPVVLADAYPARLDGRLEAEGLSRWLWLVKWVLVIPHVVVLAFLWIAAVVLTVVAGFAILFTGRYPRSIFDFNVGVMRWSWRVGFYSFSAFGTDRYPPFSLRPDPGYPAEFTVDHPEQLSRGLVLVKWWLLAIPHLIIVAIFAGGWGAGADDRWRIAGGGGLIAVVALIAVAIHAVRGQYPRELFHFVMGLNRWVFRVWAYVWLMRDEYPPFRFDGGGTDPGSKPVAPPPTRPEAPADERPAADTTTSTPTPTG